VVTCHTCHGAVAVHKALEGWFALLLMLMLMLMLMLVTTMMLLDWNRLHAGEQQLQKGADAALCRHSIELIPMQFNSIQFHAIQFNHSGRHCGACSPQHLQVRGGVDICAGVSLT